MSTLTPPVTLLQGDARAVLATLPPACVQCVVTSPPFYAKRDYGTAPQVWGGAVPGCEHIWQTSTRHLSDRGGDGHAGSTLQGSTARQAGQRVDVHEGACARCGAWCGQLGQERTPDAYVAHLVEVFGAVKRVLRDDGVLFLNLASGYSSGIIEAQEYILRDDLTREETAYVYAELAQWFISQSEAMSEMRAAAASAEQDVSGVLRGGTCPPAELPGEGV